MKLNIGCGRNPMSGCMNLDITDGPGVDVVCDLELPGGGKLPFQDNTFEEIYATHVLEHINNILPLMQELHRVARAGCKMYIEVPYGSSDDADEDPTHVRRFFLNSFGYFSQPFYWRADYGYRGDWSCESITLNLAWGVEEKIKAGRGKLPPRIQLLDLVRESRNVVQTMRATLVAVAPREALKALQDHPRISLVTVNNDIY